MEGALVGASEAMRRVQKTIGMAADSDATVLILGETGTGKELVAHACTSTVAAHGQARSSRSTARRSRRSSWKASCSAMSKAPSPARTHDRRAHFEYADGGTLFLDEIGDMPHRHAGQAPARPAGTRLRRRSAASRRGRRPRLAATHRDLESSVAPGRSGRISSIGSTSCRSRCRRCGNGWRTSAAGGAFPRLPTRNGMHKRLS